MKKKPNEIIYLGQGISLKSRTQDERKSEFSFVDKFWLLKRLPKGPLPLFSGTVEY